MKDENDILRKAVDQLKGEAVPAGPPKDLVEATVSKLDESKKDNDANQQVIRHVNFGRMGNFGKIFPRIAAAAVLMLTAGYAVGRLTAPQPPDIEELRQELRASLEPTIKTAIQNDLHETLSQEMNQRWQLAFAKAYIQIKGELSQQYRDDLNRFAAQTLAASNAKTNELLGDLVKSIGNAQSQDMQRFAEAIYYLEQQRLKDKTQLTKGLQTLAYETDDELQRTKQQVFSLLSDAQPGGQEFDGQDKLNHFDTRKE